MQDEKLTEKPAKSVSAEPLNLSKAKALAKISSLASYRGDLVAAAKIRYNRRATAVAIGKGYSKKALKSTKRSSKK